MKKLILVVLLTLCLTGCALAQSDDALKFKKEYESLNNEKDSAGNYRKLSISKDNPFVYSTPSEIIDMIEDEDTFYIYFGSSYCPWCRSVIEKAAEVANQNKIEEIYYIDIWEGDHKEILRDTYKLNDEGKPELVFEGAKEYKTLLKYLDNVLADYTLTDDKGNAVSTGEKRIMAPNFIYIKDGEAVKLITGISEKQDSSKAKLTKKILKDEENIFNNFFKKTE